jgi:hypothetical protein
MSQYVPSTAWSGDVAEPVAQPAIATAPSPKPAASSSPAPDMAPAFDVASEVAVAETVSYQGAGASPIAASTAPFSGFDVSSIVDEFYDPIDSLAEAAEFVADEDDKEQDDAAIVNIPRLGAYHVEPSYGAGVTLMGVMTWGGVLNYDRGRIPGMTDGDIAATAVTAGSIAGNHFAPNKVKPLIANEYNLTPLPHTAHGFGNDANAGIPGDGWLLTGLSAPFLLQGDQFTYPSDHPQFAGGTEYRVGVLHGTPLAKGVMPPAMQNTAAYSINNGAVIAAQPYSVLNGHAKKNWQELGGKQVLGYNASVNATGPMFWKGLNGSIIENDGNVERMSLSGTLALFSQQSVGPKNNSPSAGLTSTIVNMNRIGFYQSAGGSVGVTLTRAERPVDSVNRGDPEVAQAVIKNQLAEAYLNGDGEDKAIAMVLAGMGANEGRYESFGEPQTQQIHTILQAIDKNAQALQISDYYHEGKFGDKPLSYQELSELLPYFIDSGAIAIEDIAQSGGLDFGIPQLAQANGAPRDDYFAYRSGGEKGPVSLPPTTKIVYNDNGEAYYVNSDDYNRDLVAKADDFESLDAFLAASPYDERIDIQKILNPIALVGRMASQSDENALTATVDRFDYISEAGSNLSQSLSNFPSHYMRDNEHPLTTFGEAYQTALQDIWDGSAYVLGRLSEEFSEAGQIALDSTKENLLAVAEGFFGSPQTANASEDDQNFDDADAVDEK